MTSKLWLQAIALAAVAAAAAAGTGGVARALSVHQPLAALTAQTHAESECGSGGAGGQGGDGGSPGQPGKPGTHECTRYSDLPDKPKDKLTVADKVRVVLVLINGGATEAQIAEKYNMPKHEVEVWKQAYRNGDWSVLMGND